MGHVSDSVVGYAHCPVLIVRNKGRLHAPVRRSLDHLGYAFAVRHIDADEQHLLAFLTREVASQDLLPLCLRAILQPQRDV
jgi:hypothetical protein